MALYYFDIHDGTERVLDEEGSEFDTMDAAVQGAIRSAVEIGRGRLEKGDIGDIIVDVRDENRQKLITITAALKIEWHTDGPSPS